MEKHNIFKPRGKRFLYRKSNTGGSYLKYQKNSMNNEGVGKQDTLIHSIFECFLSLYLLMYKLDINYILVIYLQLGIGAATDLGMTVIDFAFLFL